MPSTLNNVFSLSRRVVSSFKTLSIVSLILFIWERSASLFALATKSLAALSSSKFFKRALISLLLISSSASRNFLFSLAMSLSRSISFAKLFVNSPRMLCSASFRPLSSRYVSPSVCVRAFLTSSGSSINV